MAAEAQWPDGALASVLLDFLRDKGLLDEFEVYLAEVVQDDDAYDDDDGLTDVEADAMTLRDVGWGTDEDYGLYDTPFEYDTPSEF